MNYISLSAASETLKDWFQGQPNADTISLNDIFASAGRNPENSELNKRWVGNKMTHLKHYGLVKPVYGYGRRKVLEKIQLTDEGKRIVGHSVSTSSSPPQNTPVTLVSLESIATLIDKFEEQNPSIQLDLAIKVIKKEGSEDI